MGRVSLPRRELERCQYTTPPYRWSWPLGAIRWGRLLRARVPEAVSGPPGLGRPSGFEEGEWVRVKPAEEIRATLDATGSLRGLWFTEGQWSYCGRTFQVDCVVRRMLDDQYRMRSISRATTLAGVTCQGLDGGSGCGRHCALLFRDEWLERSHPAADGASPAASGPRWSVRVRSEAEIRRTLDRAGKRDGVCFTRGMERFCGGPQVAERVTLTHLPAWQHPVGEWYVLDGARCFGEPLAAHGPCHRRCAFLWHRDWLEFEP